MLRNLHKAARSSSQTLLNIPNSSPLASRKDNHISGGGNSAQNSPGPVHRSHSKAIRPRPRSYSDERINNEDGDRFEAVALLSQVSEPAPTSNSSSTKFEMEKAEV